MDEDFPMDLLIPSFDTRESFELAFQCHCSEVNQHPAAEVMPVLLKTGQSIPSNSPVWRVGPTTLSNSPIWRVGTITPSNSPIWRVGPTTLPSPHSRSSLFCDRIELTLVSSRSESSSELYSLETAKNSFTRRKFGFLV